MSNELSHLATDSPEQVNFQVYLVNSLDGAATKFVRDRYTDTDRHFLKIVFRWNIPKYINSSKSGSQHFSRMEHFRRCR